MSIQTATNRFIVSPLQAVRAELYQEIFRSAVSFQELGNRLIRYAEHAQAIRQMEVIQEVGQVLANFPIRDYQAVGQYYLTLCDYKYGIDNREAFEQVAEYAPKIYRARALQSLAAIEARKQDYPSEMRWLIESMKVSPSAEALRGMAIVKAKEGYHTHAVNDLELLHGLVRHSDPVSYLQYLNSYAVELGEIGRKQEARNISRIVLASPFIHAYPEWQETARDLKVPDRSSVFIDSRSGVPQNVLLMPATEHGEKVARHNEPARVLSMQKWKKKMGKDKKETGEKPPETPTKLQIINQIVLFYTNKNTTDEQRYKIWEAVVKIIYPPETEPGDGEGA